MLVILIVGAVMAVVSAGMLLTDFGHQSPARRHGQGEAQFTRSFDREGSGPGSSDRVAPGPGSSERVASLGGRAPGRTLRAVPDAAAPHAPSVSVVIPALNEAGSLPWVLEQIPSSVSEVILVDGLSTDGTEALARLVRPDIVVVHQPQRGKGAALRAGFAAATGDIIVMIDADGSTDPREMPRFVDALLDGADFVKGSRHMQAGGSADFTRMRSAGNIGFVKLANLLYRSRFTDLCYGYCAFWRHHLDALALSADGFEIETQLVLNAVKAGLAIQEVPSFELERRVGTSNLNVLRDGQRVLRTLLSGRRRSQPGPSPATAGIDLVQYVLPDGLVYQAQPAAQRELAA